YRDPHLSETLETYKNAGDFVRNFDASTRDMTKYIIGTISSMDQPLEPSALGDRSFRAYQSGITVEMLQKERNQVLSATVDTIRSLAGYVDAMMGEETVCAIGNDKKIEEEKEIFSDISGLAQC
ncbi:MAG: insulinase family protein, partial [Eubacterium sp.]|nr:insulinase family protein [Eubacterium sp.]